MKCTGICVTLRASKRPFSSYAMSQIPDFIDTELRTVRVLLKEGDGQDRELQLADATARYYKPGRPQMNTPNKSNP